MIVMHSSHLFLTVTILATRVVGASDDGKTEDVILRHADSANRSTKLAAANILAISHVLPSHAIQVASLAAALQRRGHTVYFALNNGSHLQKMMLDKQFHILEFSVPQGVVLPDTFDYNDALFPAKPRSIWDEMDFFNSHLNTSYNFCRLMLEDKSFIAAIKDRNISMVILDGYSMDPCLFLLPYNLSLPFVHISENQRTEVLGVPTLPSFVPSLVLPFTAEMTFMERILNTVSSIFLTTLTQIQYSNSLLRQYAPEVSSWLELINKASFFIKTRDFHLEWPEPSMPHMIFVPGVTYENAKPLHKELEKIAQEVKVGVILMSFGTAVDNMPQETSQKFLDAFRMFPDYTIIWRFKGKLEGLDIPDNVRVESWIPQNDILGHSKTLLFITHCGNGGQYEAAYHGVPMIGFPLMADQHHNAKRMVHHNLGVSLDIRKFTTIQLVTEIQNVLKKQDILSSVRKMSDILKSLQPPSERAADAVEHVMRFGSNHLVGPSITMPMYSFLMIDVCLFVELVVIITVVVTGWLCTICCRKFICRKNVAEHGKTSVRVKME